MFADYFTVEGRMLNACLAKCEINSLTTAKSLSHCIVYSTASVYIC